MFSVDAAHNGPPASGHGGISAGLLSSFVAERANGVVVRLQSPVPLATAMGRAPDVFPRVYVAMVEAGEAGGFLDVVLAQIAGLRVADDPRAGHCRLAVAGTGWPGPRRLLQLYVA